MPVYVAFAELLDRALTDAERSESWLAQRIGVHRSTVNRWRRGEARPDTPELIVRVTDCLGVFDANIRQTWLVAAGYAIPNTTLPWAQPTAQEQSAHSPGWMNRAIQAAPEWLAQVLLKQHHIYKELAWDYDSTVFPVGCGDHGLDLAQQRLALSTAFGAYFASLLERDYSYAPLTGQIDAPTPRGLEAVGDLGRVGWALHHPRGPRAIVVAADAGMGKSTLAARLVRCLMQQGDFDLLLGDSAKRERVSVFTGAVSALPHIIYDVSSCFEHLRTQLGLPSRPGGNEADIADRLAGRRTLLVIDNLDTIGQQDELLRRLNRLLNRDIRAILTTRRIDALPAFSLQALVVNLRPIQDLVTLGVFLRWHIQHFQSEANFLRDLDLDQSPDAGMKRLLERTGGVPLLIQLVFMSIARLSWAYLDSVPFLFGAELLNYLYLERWRDLEEQGVLGRCAQAVLHIVAAAQRVGQRTDGAQLLAWAQAAGLGSQLAPALNLLHERFLLVNHDRTNGDFVIFPSFLEFIDQRR